MKKCINCGKPASNNNETLCRYCSSKLVESASVTCRNCGAPVDGASRFCPNCATEMIPGITAPPVMYKDSRYPRRGFYKKRHSDKVLLITVAIALVILIIATTVLCTVLLLKDRNSKKDSPPVSNKETSITTDKNKEPNYGEEIKTSETRSPYDYDPDNGDWYRLRKSRWDASSQIGAYKTYESALDDFEKYGAQGYNLYDKDFNLIKAGSYNNTQNKSKAPLTNNYSESKKTSALHDYDPDNGDWYRLRKSRWDASSQVGAYKTVEKALYYAKIYKSQGYILFDKDFNVIE